MLLTEKTFLMILFSIVFRLLALGSQ